MSKCSTRKEEEWHLQWLAQIQIAGEYVIVVIVVGVYFGRQQEQIVLVMVSLHDTLQVSALRTVLGVQQVSAMLRQLSKNYGTTDKPCAFLARVPLSTRFVCCAMNPLYSRCRRWDDGIRCVCCRAKSYDEWTILPTPLLSIKESRIPSPIQISIISSVLRPNIPNHPILSVEQPRN